MKIVRLARETKPSIKFKRKEWEFIHPEHYGVKMDWNYWDRKELVLKAVEKGKIIGVLVGDTLAGILDIGELIIDHTKRENGVGKKLMQEALSWAKGKKAHRTYLITGKDWKAIGFYKSLGFKITAELPNYYSKTDFVIMTKPL